MIESNCVQLVFGGVEDRLLAPIPLGGRSAAAAAGGPIDVVIANAGYGHEGIFEESPLAELRKQFAVNVFGAVATVQAVLPQMRARRSGHIPGITSMGGS